MSDSPLRFGVLGAARITPGALVAPARKVAGAELVAIAARDPARARAFAEKHGVPRVAESYAALIDDPELDAIYNPLPNGLHCEWTIRALRAGKHVLCEKPLASNADEAARMVAAADESGRLLMEAFHWRYHPLAARVREIVASGEIGAVRRIEAIVCFPLPRFGDIRYQYDLAGGCLMDAGCYPVSMVRHTADAEPEVVSARAKLARPKVDRFMEAELRFADGRSARILSSMFSARLLDLRLVVRGDAGELSALNPLVPHFFHRLRVRGRDGTRREQVEGEETYTHQLRAFVDAVRNGTALPTDGRDGVANMRVIDAVYERAGLPRRGT
ncbi:MAG: Gfo/Idh/MocA family oxidoreductase [Myxococcota bacterium]|nr:Gfo/Idh/MocA family oxidoreductase [Myxococcota bacterium]